MVCRKRLRFHKVCHERNGGTRVTNKRGNVEVEVTGNKPTGLQTLLKKLRFQPDFIYSDLNDWERSVSKMDRDLLSFVSTQMRGRKKSFSWQKASWNLPTDVVKSATKRAATMNPVSALSTLGKLSRVLSTVRVLFPEVTLAISFTDRWVKVRGDSQAHRSPWWRCWALGFLSLATLLGFVFKRVGFVALVDVMLAGAGQV